MNGKTLKVVIPMAGLGTRLRPHTWSKPKQLVGVAGKTVLDHVLHLLETVPDGTEVELVSIVGYLGEQIEAHLKEQYPHLTIHTVVQGDPRGQSHALYLAREYIHGPTLVVFADTLIDADLSFLVEEDVGAIAWVKAVEDPRRFGVADADEDGWVTSLVEKPSDMSNNLVVVGCYYFRSGEDLIQAIEEQMDRDIQLKGEYYLADAVNLMLDDGLKMRTQSVDLWLDAGTPEAMLETNRELLERGSDNFDELLDREEDAVFVPPVYIHPSAYVENAVVGPHVSVGPGARITDSVVRNSIIEGDAEVEGAFLEASLLGNRARVTGRAKRVNAGDDATVET